jgi:hypothetical protein
MAASPPYAFAARLFRPMAQYAAHSSSASLFQWPHSFMPCFLKLVSDWLQRKQQEIQMVTRTENDQIWEFQSGSFL